MAGQPWCALQTAGGANTEFLQRRAACGRLGHPLSQFIQFVVHYFPFESGELLSAPGATNHTSAILLGVAASLAALHTRFARNLSPRLCPARQPETCERHAGETDTEFLECGAARGGLGHGFSEFIEFVIHTFPFILVWCSACCS
jgi:hypothetical protein